MCAVVTLLACDVRRGGDITSLPCASRRWHY